MVDEIEILFKSFDNVIKTLSLLRIDDLKLILFFVNNEIKLREKELNLC